MYLDFLIDCLYRPDQTVAVDKKTVTSALERSSDCTFLTDRYFVIWAQLLDDETKVMEVIEKGNIFRPFLELSMNGYCLYPQMLTEFCNYLPPYILKINKHRLGLNLQKLLDNNRLC